MSKKRNTKRKQSDSNEEAEEADDSLEQKRFVWTTEMVEDLVSIICDNENLKSNLIFRNVTNKKNSEYFKMVVRLLGARMPSHVEEGQLPSITQCRSKFKRLISECKTVALKGQTASGIKNYKIEKGYDKVKWFDMLLALVKTRDSCRLELAFEPTVIAKRPHIGLFPDISLDNEHDDAIASTSETSKEEKKKLFVPIKKKKTMTADDPLHILANAMDTMAKSNPSDMFMKYLEHEREQKELDRKHELEMARLKYGGHHDGNVGQIVPNTQYPHTLPIPPAQFSPHVLHQANSMLTMQNLQHGGNKVQPNERPFSYRDILNGD